ncbi:MAG: hypothetical protein ACTHQ3_12715 [Motilibacteraceae bacterium]
MTDHQDEPVPWAWLHGSPPALAEGGWAEFRGGPLGQPVWLRFAQVAGRRAVVAVLVGGAEGEEPAEVKGEDLRRLRLGELLAATFEVPEPEPGAGQYDDPTAWEAAVVQDFIGRLPEVAESPRRRGVAPTDDELRTFAAVYQRELQRRPRSAMTSAARQCNLSRTTANRWAKICRERGFLPEREA